MTMLRASLLASAAVFLAACDPAEEGVLPEANEPEAVQVDERAAPGDPSGLPDPVVALDPPDGDLIGFLNCATQDATLISAHRGGVEPGYPENGIETFANVLAQGPMVIEMDVNRSADGVLLMMHDDTLDRTTTGEGAVVETDWDEIETLRLVDNDGTVTEFGVPTLDEVLDWAAGRAIVQLDVKRSVEITDVVDAVAAHDAYGFAKIITYSVEDAAAVSAADPDVIFSLQIEEPGDLETLEAAGVDTSRLVGWTGLGDEPLTELWTTLDQRDIPVSFGTMWRLDETVAETGDASVFVPLVEQGVDILATDLHREAYAALEAEQDTVGAVSACL